MAECRRCRWSRRRTGLRHRAINRIKSSLTPACFKATNPGTLVSKFVRELWISYNKNNSSNPAFAPT